MIFELTIKISHFKPKIQMMKTLSLKIKNKKDNINIKRQLARKIIATQKHPRE